MKRFASIILLLGLVLAACSAPEDAEPQPFILDLTKHKNDFDTASIEYSCEDPKFPKI